MVEEGREVVESGLSGEARPGFEARGAVAAQVECDDRVSGVAQREHLRREHRVIHASAVDEDDRSLIASEHREADRRARA